MKTRRTWKTQGYRSMSTILREALRHSVTLTELQHTRIQYRLVAALLAGVKPVASASGMWIRLHLAYPINVA